MTHDNASKRKVNTTEDGVQAPTTRRYKKPVVLATLAALGALAISPVADGASASTGARQATSSPKLAVTQLVPPTGTVWIQGRLTDQAGHGLDSVNVEVWPNDPAATAPVGIQPELRRLSRGRSTRARRLPSRGARRPALQDHLLRSRRQGRW